MSWGEAMTLPVPSSSWIVIDGVVWPSNVLPRATPVGGKVTAARQEIRRQMKARR